MKSVRSAIYYFIEAHKYKLPDDEGLYILVNLSATKTFKLKYRIDVSTQLITGGLGERNTITDRLL